MSRKLLISYDRSGIVLRSVTVLVDDSAVCTLKNHSAHEAEVSEEEHAVVVKLSNYPILKSTMTAGENDWTLSYENDVGSFVLYESKPLFKK